MRINLEHVSYKNLNDLTFDIQDKKITGIVCDDIKDLININYIILNDIKDNGNIKYSQSKKNKIGIVSISNINEMINGQVSNYILENIDNSLIELLDIDNEILHKDINVLSNTEKIKILFLKCLTEDNDTILINGILEELDTEKRKKFIKLIINLNKFKKKTIVISSVDIDIIYEFIDNLVLIINGNSICTDDKYNIYRNDAINKNPLIKKPFVKKIENMVYNKSNINLGENSNINELIKAIYREIR